MPLTQELIVRLAKVDKYERKLTDLARAYKGLNAARRNIELVLQRETSIKSIIDVDDLEAYLKNLHSKNEASSKEITRLAALEKSLQEQMRHLKQSLQVEKDSISDLQEHNSQLKRDLDMSRKEIQVMKGQLTRLREKSSVDVKTLREKIDVLTSDNVSLQAKCSRLEGLVNATTNRADQNEEQEGGDNASSQVLLTRLVESIQSTAKSSCLDVSDIIARLPINDLDKLRELLAIPAPSTPAQIEESVPLHTFNELKAEVDRLSKQSFDNDAILAEKDRLECQINELRESKEVAEKQAWDLNQEFDSYKGCIEELREMLAAKDEEIEKLRRQADQAELAGKLSTNESQLKSVRGELAELTRSHDRVAAEHESEKQQLLATLDESKRKVRELEEQLLGQQEEEVAKELPAKATDNRFSTTAVGLSEERVWTIVDACLAGSLSIANSDIASSVGQQLKSQSKVSGGKRKGGKKGKKGQQQAHKSTSPHVEVLVTATEDEVKKLAEILERIRGLNFNAQGNGISADASSDGPRDAASADLEAKLVEARKEMQKVTDERDLLLNDVESSKVECARLESKLQEAEATITDTRGALEHTEVALKSAEERLRQAESKSAELAKELETVNERTRDSEARSAEAMRQVEQLQAKLKVSKADVARLHETVKALNTEKALVQAKVGEQQAAADKAKSDAQKQSEEARQLQGRLNDQMALTKQFQDQLTKVEEDLAEFQRAYEDRERAAMEGERRIKELEGMVDRLKQEVEQGARQGSEWKYAEAQKSVQIKELEGELEDQKHSKKEAVDRIKAELEQVIRDAEEVQRSLYQTVTERDAQIAALKERIAEMASRNRSESEWQRMEERQRLVEAELDTLRNNLRDAEESKVGMKVKLERLRDAERELEETKDQLRWTKDNQKQREEQLRQMVQVLKGQVRQLQRRIRSIQSQQQQQQSEEGPIEDTTSDDNNTSEPHRANGVNESSIQVELFGSNSSRFVNLRKGPSSPEAVVSLGSDKEGGDNVSVASDRDQQQSQMNQVSVDYLRNVLFMFIKDKTHRRQLVPVLSTLLRCDPRDIDTLQKHIG
ncbi:Golgin imh1 [Spiromyces aspiralis]|uniref:Golgin imh1 n=1 Tax=Spiromyces aspiralis TaxID=68401 RepID=A0ACC1HY09_9FUNG|nr:Golgin imh1 [Spiromyces aspiralis]